MDCGCGCDGDCGGEDMVAKKGNPIIIGGRVKTLSDRVKDKAAASKESEVKSSDRKAAIKRRLAKGR